MQTSEENNEFSDMMSKASGTNALSTMSGLGMGKKVKSAISMQNQTLMAVKNAYETSIEKEIAAIKSSYKPSRKDLNRKNESSTYVRFDSFSD